MRNTIITKVIISDYTTEQVLFIKWNALGNIIFISEEYNSITTLFLRYEKEKKRSNVQVSAI